MRNKIRTNHKEFQGNVSRRDNLSNLLRASNNFASLPCAEGLRRVLGVGRQAVVVGRQAVVVGKPVLHRVLVQEVHRKVLVQVVRHKEHLREEGKRLQEEGKRLVEHHKVPVEAHGQVEGTVGAGLRRE